MKTYLSLAVTMFALFLFWKFLKNRLMLNSRIQSPFNYDKYKKELARMESNNNPKAVNPYSGALGLYQFMPSTLNDLRDRFKLKDWKNKETFLNDITLQEDYLYYYVKNTLKMIDEPSFNNFYGTSINGRLRFPDIVTPANIYGAVAAAHLAGVGGVKRFIVDGIDRDDGKTSVSDYFSYFSNKFQYLI